MDTTYDLEAWAEATTRGRRVFNYNYRMRGDELRGWDLVNAVPTETGPGRHEVVYLWEKQRSAGKEQVRIGIAEADNWRAAQRQLREVLQHSMRPSVPRGTGKLEALGDINYIGQGIASTRVASFVFCLGNVTLTIASVGDKEVDVASVAQFLDHALGEAPAKQTPKAGKLKRLPLPARKVIKGQRSVLIKHLPQRDGTGWHKLIAPDGELAREDDSIVYVSPSAGEKKFQHYQVAP